MRDEIALIAADPASHPDLLRDVFERADRNERAVLARQVFDALEPEQQWSIVERLFTDDELHEFLAVKARATRSLDTREIAAGEVLELGLFREDGVRAALTRGHRSTAAARLLTLRCLGEGNFQVLADVFNPDGGYFVTRDYDETTWRENEKFESHARVRVGSIVDNIFEPVLHPGGRVDVRLEDHDVRGRLFLGFAMLSGAGVFAP